VSFGLLVYNQGESVDRLNISLSANSFAGSGSQRLPLVTPLDGQVVSGSDLDSPPWLRLSLLDVVLTFWLKRPLAPLRFDQLGVDLVKKRSLWRFPGPWIEFFLQILLVIDL
jgi:hypothetical protein